jgi:phospholipase C
VIDNAALGYNWTTYPERLEEAGISWKVYQDIGLGLDAPNNWGWTKDAFIGTFGDNALLNFENYRNARPGDPLFEKARTGTDHRNGDGYFDILRADVQAGKLPQVSWVVSPEAYSEHPNWPSNYGAWYISQVIDVLTSNPEVWSKTALFITYDENDGYFDHCIPPLPAIGEGRGASTVPVDAEAFGLGSPDPVPYGLGIRVPMLVVSPWSRGGKVCSEVFDHTSILRFLERRFGVAEPNITPWRRTVVGDLTSAFDFTSPEVPLPGLPSTSAYAPVEPRRHPDYVPEPPDQQSVPRQEAGQRTLLPLPYKLSVDSRVDGDHMAITFANHGQAGAHFLVTSSTSAEGPWNYTVGAGSELTGTWPFDATGYDFFVHGPAGFFRHFRGGQAADSPPEISTGRADEDGIVEFALKNGGQGSVQITVENGYATPSKTVCTLGPGESAVHTVRTEDSDHWYDVSFRTDTDNHFLRRFAGHTETGSASMTDPAILST